MPKKDYVITEYNVGLFADSNKYAICLVSLTNGCYTVVEERFNKQITYKNIGDDLNDLTKNNLTAGVNVNKLLDIPKLTLDNYFCNLIEKPFNFEQGNLNMVGLIGDKKLILPVETAEMLRHLNPKDKNNHRVNALILALTDFLYAINPMIGT